MGPCLSQMWKTLSAGAPQRPAAGGPEGEPFDPSKDSRVFAKGDFPLSISPSVRYLLIVAAKQPDLWRYLTHNFAGDPKVEVILDRRRGERRKRVEKHEPERRRARRRQPSPQSALAYRSVVIIHRQEEAVSG